MNPARNKCGSLPMRFRMRGGYELGICDRSGAKLPWENDRCDEGAGVIVAGVAFRYFRPCEGLA